MVNCMADDKETNWAAILLGIAVLWLLISPGTFPIGVNGTPIGSPQSIYNVNLPESGQGGDTYNTYNTYEGNGQESGNPSLCTLMEPYLYALDVENTCNLHNGDYSCRPDLVGCEAMQVPIDAGAVCNSLAYATASHQCSAVGAVPVCNANNVGCYYG